MTLPKSVRDRLKLKPGDQLDVVVEGERIVLLPKTYTLDELMRVLPKPKVRLSLSDMDQVIHNRATKRARSR
jgi:AbrB family looped-hinge helix DNA binding protein